MNSTISTATVSDTIATPTGTISGSFSGGILYKDNLNNYFVYLITIAGSSGTPVAGFRYDISTNTFQSDETFGTNRYNKPYAGGALMQDGKIYLVPEGGGSALIYNPLINSSLGNLETPNGSFPTGSGLFAGAVLLPNGNVFCYSATAGLAARIYNPFTNTLTTAGGTYDIGFNDATLMADGRVFLTPYSLSNSARIYDPNTNTLTTPNVSLPSAISWRSTILSDGRIVLVSNGSPNAYIRIYYPDLDILVTPSVTPATGVNGCSLLPNGKILLIPQSKTTAQIYDPNIDTFTTSSAIFPSTSYASAVLMPNGKTLLIATNSSPNNSRIYGGGESFNNNVLLSSYYNNK